MKLTLGKMVIETENAADLGMLFEGLGKANVDINSMLGIKAEKVAETPVVVAKSEPVIVDTVDTISKNDLDSDFIFDKSESKTILSEDTIKYPRTLTRSELAPILGVSNACIGQYIKDGMPCDKSSSVFKYNADECIIWQKKNRKDCPLRGRKRPTYKKGTVVKTDFGAWQKSVFDIIRQHGKDNGKVCSEVFKRMTRIYGVVWDQVKKDFYHENEYYAKSTLQLAYWLQTTNSTYENMFEGCLKAVLEEAA